MNFESVLIVNVWNEKIKYQNKYSNNIIIIIIQRNLLLFKKIFILNYRLYLNTS